MAITFEEVFNDTAKVLARVLLAEQRVQQLEAELLIYQEKELKPKPKE